MQIMNRITPFNTFDPTHPLLAYVIRDVRGGRTPEGLQRYSMQVVAVLAALMFGGFFLTISIYDPTYPDEYFRLQAGLIYTMVTVGVSIGFFIVADLVTLFYTAHAVRAELHRDVKFELLRTTTLGADEFMASRMALGQVRAWRVYVVLIGLRWLAALLAIVVALWGFIVFLIESRNNLTAAEFFRAMTEPNVIFFIAFFALAILIFAVMLLWEPLWRFRMLTTLAVSMATRIRAGFLVWILLAGAYLLALSLQGALAAGVTTLGAWGYNLVEDVFFRNAGYRYDFENQVALLAGVLPYALMPVAVWLLQRAFSGWRLRVAERYVFMRRGDDR